MKQFVINLIDDCVQVGVMFFSLFLGLDFVGGFAISALKLLGISVSALLLVNLYWAMDEARKERP